MKAKYADGQALYVTHLIIGTDFYTGTRVTVVESYSERGAETRYLVKNDSRFKVYVYESDLDTIDPSSLACPVTCTVRSHEHGLEEQGDCEGHPSGPYDQMGRTVYCDGSCQVARNGMSL